MAFIEDVTDEGLDEDCPKWHEYTAHAFAEMLLRARAGTPNLRQLRPIFAVDPFATCQLLRQTLLVVCTPSVCPPANDGVL